MRINVRHFIMCSILLRCAKNWVKLVQPFHSYLIGSNSNNQTLQIQIISNNVFSLTEHQIFYNKLREKKQLALATIHCLIQCV